MLKNKETLVVCFNDKTSTFLTILFEYDLGTMAVLGLFESLKLILAQYRIPSSVDTFLDKVASGEIDLTNNMKISIQKE